MKEKLTLNQKEQTRVIVLNQVETKQIGVVQAAVLLNISERQAWRLLSAYRKSGAVGLGHGYRERKSVNELSDELKWEVISFTASSLNSLVYLPPGIPFIRTPPSFYFT